MSSSRKLVYSILFVFLLMIAFFVTGILAPEEYEGERTATFPDSKMDVWKNLTTLETIPKRKNGIERIEIIEESRSGVVWIEHLKNGKQRTLRVAEREMPNFFVVERIQSDDGLTGRWEFYISENKETQKTEIKVIEESRNTNVVLRAWHTILGRSINLRREIKSLHVSIFQRLLTTP